MESNNSRVYMVNRKGKISMNQNPKKIETTDQQEKKAYFAPEIEVTDLTDAILNSKMTANGNDIMEGGGDS